MLKKSNGSNLDENIILSETKYFIFLLFQNVFFMKKRYVMVI